MNILEILKNNSKISFYFILTIFLIILFYPSCDKKPQKSNENNKKYKNIFSNLKLFTDYTLL